MINDAAKQAGLDDAQRRQLGRYVEQETRHYGEDFGYDDILQSAQEIARGETLINTK